MGLEVKLNDIFASWLILCTGLVSSCCSFIFSYCSLLLSNSEPLPVVCPPNKIPLLALIRGETDRVARRESKFMKFGCKCNLHTAVVWRCARMYVQDPLHTSLFCFRHTCLFMSRWLLERFMFVVFVHFHMVDGQQRISRATCPMLISIGKNIVNSFVFAFRL